jgi:hypothetical protein
VTALRGAAAIANKINTVQKTSARSNGITREIVTEIPQETSAIWKQRKERIGSIHDLSLTELQEQVRK